ncbi:hypothetical protein Tco_0761924 [Tanacetum coccineum]
MKKVNRGPRKQVDLSTVSRSSRVADKPPQAYKEVSFSKCNLLGLSGWQLTKFVKRKLSDVYESESDSNDDSLNQDIIIIKVEYADDVFKIHLSVSLATLVVVKEEINKRCKLNPRTCNFKYLEQMSNGS